MISAQPASGGLFRRYATDAFFDGMFAGDGAPRPHYERIFNEFAAMRPRRFEQRRHLADSAFLLQGITFTVYSDGRGTERLFPSTWFRASFPGTSGSASSAASRSECSR